MSSEQIYPKPAKDKSGLHLERRWRVDYTGLVYDDGPQSWSQGYRTWLGARLAAFWNYHLLSYGCGTVIITDAFTVTDEGTTGES